MARRGAAASRSAYVRTTRPEAAAAARLGAGLRRRKHAELLGLLRPCFARVEPWLQAGNYAALLMCQIPRRNGWTIVEYAGDRTADNTQGLLWTAPGFVEARFSLLADLVVFLSAIFGPFPPAGIDAPDRSGCQSRPQGGLDSGKGRCGLGRAGRLMAFVPPPICARIRQAGSSPASQAAGVY